VAFLLFGGIMEFSEIANEVIDEWAESYDYNELGSIHYYQAITDLANYAFSHWEEGLFTAFEDIIETELRRRGHVPTN
jgi:hypothetical protein